MTKGHKGHNHDPKRDGHPFKEHRARGGATIGGLPEIGGKPEKPETKEPQSGRKRGGGVMKKKRDHEKLKGGGKVHGKHPGHRLDRRARGGPVGKGKSPFSGADGPNLGYATGPGPMSKSMAVGKDKT